MISIERRGIGYSVKISEPGTGMRGYRVPAKDVLDCMFAVQHYYADHANEPHCPLCRKSAKESRR